MIRYLMHLCFFFGSHNVLYSVDIKNAAFTFNKREVRQFVCIYSSPPCASPPAFVFHLALHGCAVSSVPVLRHPVAAPSHDVCSLSQLSWRTTYSYHVSSRSSARQRQESFRSEKPGLDASSRQRTSVGPLFRDLCARHA